MLGSRVEPLSLSPLYPGKTSENSVKLSSHEDSCSQSPELRPTAPEDKAHWGPGQDSGPALEFLQTHCQSQAGGSLPFPQQV